MQFHWKKRNWHVDSSGSIRGDKKNTVGGKWCVDDGDADDSKN